MPTLLSWAASVGVDLCDRRDTIDAAARGLVFLLWNPLSVPKDPSAAARPATTIDGLNAAPADRGHECTGTIDDPTHAEEGRVGRLVQAMAAGDLAVPRDIAYRAWYTTARDVRDVLDQTLPAAPFTPDGRTNTRMTVDAGRHPEALSRAVEVLRSPSRQLHLGNTSLSAAELLGADWTGFAAALEARQAALTMLSHELGTPRTIGLIAAIGAAGDPTGFPQRSWSQAVAGLRHSLRRALAGTPLPGLVHPPVDLHQLWETAAACPAQLNGPQALWFAEHLTEPLGDMRADAAAALTARFPGPKLDTMGALIMSDGLGIG